MTGGALRRFALSLPETREEPHFQRTSFRVGKKIFATTTRDGKEAMVRVPDRDFLDTLLARQPRVFFSYGGWTRRNGALGVRLRAVPSDLMKDLVLHSWRSVAPRRVVVGHERG
jgi:hypothetical protein